MSERDYIYNKLRLKGIDEKDVDGICGVIIEMLDGLKIVGVENRRTVILTTLKAF